MEPANIYIDEFGNSHIDLSKKGTFSHFIYTSIIIPLKDEEKARQLRTQLCIKHHLGTDMKSKNIKDKFFDRRLRLLKDILEGLNFTIDVLVIDKSKLDSAKGLKQQSIFYKYFQNLFVSKYNQRFESFSIWADSVGDSQFKKELEEYVTKKSMQLDIFSPIRTFQLADDIHEEKLIQFADILCGSIGKVFCASHAHPRAREIYEILHTRMTVRHFPSSYTTIQSKKTEQSTKVDEHIRRINHEMVQKFLYDIDSKCSAEQSRLLEYLLLHGEISPSRLVPTYEITMYMNNFFHGYSDERLRTLIRDLRYEGIFIISHSGKPGYKLASGYEDIKQHYDHFMKYVVPMLTKISILNRTISENSSNQINPLENDSRLTQLKELLVGFK